MQRIRRFRFGVPHGHTLIRKGGAEGDSKKDRASGRLRHAEQQVHHENDGDIGENGMEIGFPRGGRALGRGAGDAEQGAFGDDLEQRSE